jgi:hypothetical protein
MMIKVQHPSMRLDRIGVGGRSYAVNEDGIAIMEPDHAETAISVGGFERVGEVDGIEAGEQIVFPRTPEEFLMVCRRSAIRPDDLREMASLLESSPVDDRAVTIAVPATDATDSAGEPAATAPVDGMAGQEVPLSKITTRLSKDELVDVGVSVGLNVEVLQRMSKDKIVEAIRERGA